MIEGVSLETSSRSSRACIDCGDLVDFITNAEMRAVISRIVHPDRREEAGGA